MGRGGPNAWTCAGDETARSPLRLDGEAFQQFVGGYYAACSGFTHDVEDVLVEDHRVAFRAVARATHTAAFRGIPASGKQIAVPTIGMARTAMGKIAEWWHAPDQLGLMQELTVDFVVRAGDPPSGSQH